AQDVFGWTEEEMLGEPFSRTFLSEDVEADAPGRELREAALDGAAEDIRWHCRKGGESIFIEGETIRLGPEGEVRGFIKIGQDVTERRRAEDRLRESEARLQAIFEGASVGLSEIEPSGRIVLANDELGRILGRLPEDLRGLPVSEVTHPEDLARTLDVIERVKAGGVGAPGLGLDKRYLRPDGSAIRANSRATLLPGPDGGPGNLLVVTMDLTERWQAEEAVRESEARFRQFGEASSDALWIRDAETLEWEYLSPAFDRIFGIERKAALQDRTIEFLMNLILPEDRDKTRAAIRSLSERDAEYEFRIRRPSDGAIRWLRTTGFRLGTSEGSPLRLGGITHDMTEEKHAVARMEVLLAELQHRTRNLVGVVRAMASRTIKRSDSLDDFAARFGDRLEALARVNSLLSRLEDGERVTFDALLETELRGYGILDEEDSATQVTTRGPSGIDLPSASVQTLALALHELLTNAAKYGALSRPEGRLAVSWKVVGEAPRLLRFEWLETGIEVAEPDGGARDGGYGRELIERALPYQLGAETSYDLEPHALRCVVTLPLPKRRRRNRS
ncbi:PAS domain S-box protein, partial [Cribrihabitans sp. XS_ASV171]